MKALRTFLCLAAIFFVTNLIFYVFGISTPPVANFMLRLYYKMGFFFFWLTFSLIGLAIISILWNLFKMLSSILIWLVLSLNPYKGITFISTIVIALSSAVYSIYIMWHTIGWPSFVIGLFEIIISSMTLSLGFLIIRITGIRFGYIQEDENY